MGLFDINVMLGPTPTDAEPSINDATELLREMDHYGIEEALVYSSHARFGHPREGNLRLLRDIRGHRDRLHPCWLGMPASAGDLPAPPDFIRAALDDGVRAVRLIPDQHRFPVSVRILQSLLSSMQERGLVLLLDLERPHWSTVSPWDEIFALCEAFPRLSTVLLREGGVTDRLLFGVWEQFPKLYLETSYMQSACCLERICERFGPDRLLFGSGLPQTAPAGPVAMLHGSALTHAHRAAIGGNNARQLLGLPTGEVDIGANWDPASDRDHRIWDIHGHLGAWHKLYSPVTDAHATVKRMDAVGVDRLNLSAFTGIEHDPDTGNADVAEACLNYPGRLFGCAVYAPAKYRHDMPRFERFLDMPGMAGIKLHCDLHQTPPDDPAYRPLYECANRRGLPVLVHGGIPPERLTDLLAEFPRLTYIAAHMGAAPPEAIEPYLDIARNVNTFFLDTAGSAVPRGALVRLVEAVPVRQILYGSDFPIMDFPYQLGRILYANIDEEKKHQILWENPRRLCSRPWQPGAVNPRSQPGPGANTPPSDTDAGVPGKRPIRPST